MQNKVGRLKSAVGNVVAVQMKCVGGFQGERVEAIKNSPLI
jgi:hypothetical protein